MPAQHDLVGQLDLSRYRCIVKLGYTAAERRATQWVSFDVSLHFKTLPEACFTDQLEQTVSYEEIATVLQGVCDKQEYQLIEKLAYDAFQAVNRLLPGDVQLSLKVTKENPPIPNLSGGSSFTLTSSQYASPGESP